jgi:hypothetical protein
MILAHTGFNRYTDAILSWITQEHILLFIEPVAKTTMHRVIEEGIALQLDTTLGCVQAG